jgi:hypothetical protein
MKDRMFAIGVSQFLFACFIFQGAHAVVPPPDGGYPGGNTAEGSSALLSLTTGTYNTAVGLSSLRNNVVGNLNTAIGAAALLDNTANSNTATGVGALLSNTVAFQNTANGTFALFSNTTGSNNTAVGADALFSNTDGFRNNAVGILALSAHQTGNFNNAFGSLALGSDVSGASNDAFGDEALRSNTTGTSNTAVGDLALHDNNGSLNCAFGSQSLKANTTGDQNTAIGTNALSSNTTGINNTAVGMNALNQSTTGQANVALGVGAGAFVTTASGVICIGAQGDNLDSTTWISGIYGTTTVSGSTLPVVVSHGGQLGTMSSSRRFKRDIEPMGNASQGILGLKPVTFHYKSDKTGTPQFGLIAEEVAEVNADLVVRDENRKAYSVRYDAVNAMLLNEFLKEHRVVQQQGATITRLEKQIEVLTASLQNIKTQFELSKDARRTVLNERANRLP